MLSIPTYNQVRFYFNKTFIKDELKQSFKPAFDRLNFGLYNDITDYLNSTVTKVVWPGMEDDAITTQHGVRRDTRTPRTRQNQSSKAPEELVEKVLAITFSTKESYFNWLILYCNFLEHMKYKNAGKKVHLPDCTIHIFDDNGSVFMSIVFTGVTFESIDKMEFHTQDSKFVNRDFQLSLTYNDFDMRFFVDNDLTEKAIIIE